jgi:hypothetical protein
MKSAPAIPAVKIQMMQASLRCLADGLLSWLPFVGAIFAMFALWYSFCASQREKKFWNPAKPHRVIGVVSAFFGGLLWGVIDMIIIYHILNPT